MFSFCFLPFNLTSTHQAYTTSIQCQRILTFSLPCLAESFLERAWPQVKVAMGLLMVKIAERCICMNARARTEGANQAG